jgi:trimethylamine corrinoid protein
MSDAIVELDSEKAMELARKAIDEKLNLLDAIEKGFGEGIRKAGDMFNEGDFFLPELMMSAQIMQDAIAMLNPHLKKNSQSIETKGVVVIATIQGDIHSIGKTLVGIMLKANGYEVIDLGADVPYDVIINTAVEKHADIIGISALLTTTMTGQKQVIENLKEKGLRNNFKVIIGGAPVTARWMEECGADGYAENAIDSVALVDKLFSK